MILDRKVIAVTYLKGWFVLDFVSTVPWSRIVDALSEGGGPMVTVAKLAKVRRGKHLLGRKIILYSILYIILL